MAKAQSKLDRFLNSERWAPEYARLSLPVLVARVEQYRGQPDSEIPEFTYSDLASIVAEARYANPIQHALGNIGFALKELELTPGWKFGEIPPIQLLVWSKGKGSPGEDAFGFIGISKEQVQAMPRPVRRMTALTVRAQILEYKHWREVLASLGLEPLTIDLPDPETVAFSKSGEHSGSGESEEHKRMKLYLGTHYQKLGIKGQFTAKFEERLLSGDVADLMLDAARGTRRFCIEVKSRISSDDDLIRGIFQCVKYQSVLVANEKYECSRSADRLSKEVNVMLVTERKLPDALKQLSELLNVRVITVAVPKDYQTPIQPLP